MGHGKSTPRAYNATDLVVLLQRTEERLTAIERKLYGNGESLEAQIVRLSTKIGALEEQHQREIQEAIAATVQEMVRQQKSSSIIGIVMAVVGGVGVLFTILYNIIRGGHAG